MIPSPACVWRRGPQLVRKVTLLSAMTSHSNRRLAIEKIVRWFAGKTELLAARLAQTQLALQFCFEADSTERCLEGSADKFQKLQMAYVWH
jgi:hypothetical protein